MRKLTKKQQTLLSKFIAQYHAGSGGGFPYSVDDINPFLWAEIESLNDYETLYQDANRYINDQVMGHLYQ